MSANTLSVVSMPQAERDRIAADPDAGLGTLRTGRGNLPLELIDVQAAIVGLVGEVELTQRFTNPYAEPLEATYIFPMPDRFAVTGMTMTADERTIVAQLKERAAARAEYDQALAEGRRASIAEEERPDVFTMRVGNILPGEKVTVALSLAGPLSYEDGEAAFRFPLVVAPRYIPGEPLPGTPVGDGYAPDTDAVPDASRITPPVLLPGFPHPVQLSIAVRLDPAGLPLEQVRASLPTEPDGAGGLRVVPGQRADRDFLLRLRYGRPAHLSHALALRPDPAGEEGTFQLTVLPPTGAAPVRPRDLVLILDRSGSMAGWKMVAARRAAARIVDTLTSADRFAVRTFHAVVERPGELPAGLVEATDRHRFRAVEHLARVQAAGGTELLAPLREALDLLASPEPGPGTAGRDRVLVLVTDGQVGNEDQILRETAPALAGVRVHTVGIDQAVNAGFLGRLAAFGGGRCELVESEDRLDEAMDHIHRRIGSPVVTGLSVAGDGIDLLPGTLSPARLPDLFPGAPLLVTGRFRAGDAEPAGVGAGGGALVVHGRTGDGAGWQARVAAAGTTAGRGVTQTWARAHLRDLEDRYATGSAGRSAGQIDLAELERHIVATSLRFGVLCRFTAYVAVDSRVVTDGSGPHRVVQPVEPAAGWDMLAAPAPGFNAGVMLAGMARPAAQPAGAGPGRIALARSRRQAGDLAAPTGAAKPGPRPAVRPPASPAPEAADSLSGPVPAGAGTVVDLPAPVRQLAAVEAQRLRAASTAPEHERRQLLEDLGTRLVALVAELAAHRVDAGFPAQLRRLAEDIRTGTGELADLWARALRLLDQLAAAGPAAATGPRAPGRAFWKR